MCFTSLLLGIVALSACLVSHYLLRTVPSFAKSVSHAAAMVCVIIIATGAFVILRYVSHSEEEDLQIALQDLPKLADVMVPCCVVCTGWMLSA
jgi:hypothetical protein